ncbi:LysR family transcriptional regulator [Microtetraspora malaysiensis]|uniref:LysR family transcriptional regulator n=1 Tax=Microtetraspora malaysiensis TaxID=161358 RepID=UPI003D92D6B7
MELRQVEHFLAVNDHLSFTRAAEAVGLSQSALSSSIRSLERELGGELFSRSTRRVALTVAGEALLPLARQLVNQARRAKEAVVAVSELTGGRLAVGTVQTLSSVDLPALLAGFRRAHPGVQITLVEAPTAQLLDQVRAGDLHLAYLARDATPLPPDVLVFEERVEELVLIAAPGHRLATAGRVALADLHAEPFVDFQAGMGLQTVVRELCAREGLARVISCRVSQMDQLLALVGYGLGVAIVPEPVALRGGLPIVRLGDPAPTRTIALVTRPPVNPAARAFLAELARTRRRRD